MMTCDRQIKNSSDLLPIDTFKIALGGLKEETVRHTWLVFNDSCIIITLLDGLGRVN